MREFGECGTAPTTGAECPYMGESYKTSRYEANYMTCGKVKERGVI